MSPAHARGFERDIERICFTLAIYFELQATHGRSLSETEAADALLARHLAIVDRLVRDWELRRWQRALGTARPAMLD